MVDEQRLRTITRAAARLGVHQNTLRGWADRGLVPVVRLPSGHRRFRSADIERLRHEMGLPDDRQRQDQEGDGDGL